MTLLFSAYRETDGESSLAYVTTLGAAVNCLSNSRILWIGIDRVNDALAQSGVSSESEIIPGSGQYKEW